MLDYIVNLLNGKINFVLGNYPESLETNKVNLIFNL